MCLKRTMVLAGIGSDTMKNFVKVYSKLINYKYIDVEYIVLNLNPKPNTIWKKQNPFTLRRGRSFACYLRQPMVELLSFYK
jgi:hypothetical protein